VPGVGILDEGTTATASELLAEAKALEHLAEIRAQRAIRGTEEDIPF
jgi:hypothetical protein